ncbi:RHS repeat-associated core domain-containing protein [Elizabethkingia meningoseptica]|nr:RHS repeat-associated core domain-containing protein [Elizabethkingia meningoseptica]
MRREANRQRRFADSYENHRQGLRQNNYYPFGLKHEGYNNASLANSAYRYKYNGKELQETGMYDYGARMYMPDLGRWGVIDPLAEKYPHMYPYNYVANNPVMFVDPDGRDFGIRIDHKNKTIVIEANYYYQNKESYDKNKGALAQWNGLGATYITADGVDYAVTFDVKGIVVEEGQSVQELAANDPIGNSVQELSDNGYSSWVLGKTGSESKTQEHLDNQGGGATVRGKNIANKNSVANDKTRTHEMGHTFGQGENAGGVMDYAESFNKMSNANYANTKSILKGVYNQVKSDKSSLNNDGSTKSGTVGKSNFKIIVTGGYTGDKGFLKPKKLNEK